MHEAEDLEASGLITTGIMETTIVCWRYANGIMEKKMETTIVGLGGWAAGRAAKDEQRRATSVSEEVNRCKRLGISSQGHIAAFLAFHPNAWHQFFRIGRTTKPT